MSHVKSKVEKSPNMTCAFFKLRLNITSGGLNQNENGSIGSQDSKIKKIPSWEKFSAPPKDDPLKLWGFWGVAQLKMVKIKKNSINGLSVNKMKGKVL